MIKNNNAKNILTKISWLAAHGENIQETMEQAGFINTHPLSIVYMKCKLRQHVTLRCVRNEKATLMFGLLNILSFPVLVMLGLFSKFNGDFTAFKEIGTSCRSPSSMAKFSYSDCDPSKVTNCKYQGL